MRTIALLGLVSFIGTALAQNPYQKILNSEDGGGRAVTIHFDGDLTVAANHVNVNGLPGMQVVHYASDGSTPWSTIVRLNTGIGLPLANDIAATADGGVVVLGEHVMGPPQDSAFVVKLDVNGTILWARRFSLNDPNVLSCRMERAVVSPTGEIYLLGQATVLNGGVGQDMIITKLSASGNVLWSKRMFTAFPNNIIRPSHITLTQTGLIRVSGQVTQNYEGVFNMELDDQGNILYKGLYNAFTFDWNVNWFSFTNVGGDAKWFLTRNIDSNTDQLLNFNTDAQGNIVDALTYDIGGLNGTVRRVVPQGQSFLAVGDFEVVPGDRDAVVVRIPENGNPEGMAFGSSGNESVADAVANVMHGAMVVGRAVRDSLVSKRGGPTEVTYLIHTDSLLHSADCEMPITVTTSPTTVTQDTITFYSSDITGWSDATFLQDTGYVEVEVCNPNASLPESEAGSFVLFPNPTSGHVTLRFADPAFRSQALQLYNNLGQQVLTITDPARLSGNEVTLDVARFGPGIYHLDLVFEHGVRTHRLVVE